MQAMSDELDTGSGGHQHQHQQQHYHLPLAMVTITAIEVLLPVRNNVILRIRLNVKKYFVTRPQ